ncbi:urea ABC transporter permease subunit UrtB [Teredinibacter turnerae]|uniref:urea ABC transporter permease subunit UrtB n=1 Tax=Teredinibacter turnerae TaxID=2426 RepID=UPI000416DBF0|nr:urea ABC transporter permease subunit UrtB [Teredinibacter turnerae]
MKYTKSTAIILLVSILVMATQSFAQAPAADAQEESVTAEETVGSEATALQFETLVSQLTQRSFSKKAKVIEQLTQIKDPRILPTLKVMLDGDLYYQKADDQIVTLQKTSDGVQPTSVVTGQSLAVVGKRDVKKVTINNTLRRELRKAIAVLELADEDADLRRESARNLIKSPDPDLRDTIAQRAEAEKENSVKHLLQVAVALIDVDSDDPSLRLSATRKLGGAVEPEAVAVLKRLAQRDEQGQFVEQDNAVAKLAEERLKSVETKLSFFKFSENLLFGLSLGSVLLLAAIGLAITFGVMGVINMAHGEMIMLGAYTTFAIQQLFPSLIDISLFLAIPAAFLVSGTAGVLIERLVIRHLYGRPLDTLLATFGISLILQQAVRTYRANNVPVVTPDWMSGSWLINGAMSVTLNRVYILLFALFVLFMLALLLRKTLVGLQMRAVTQNRAMATSMGIRSNWVDALTFGLGSGIAGIAGVALSQITNVGPNLGQSYIIDSFMVVVFGGVGNLLGTFVGAMSLGVVNKFLEPVTGAVIGKIIVLIFIILFIQWRPRGLFALKGRFVED